MAQQSGFSENFGAAVRGLVKGAIILGAAGLAVGGLVGLGIDLAGGGGAFAAAAQATGLSTTAYTALASALTFGQMAAAVGAVAGAATGVMQRREPQAVDPQDIVNIANISFAQGMEAGRSQSVSMASKMDVAQTATRFQDRLAAEKAAPQAGRSV